MFRNKGRAVFVSYQHNWDENDGRLFSPPLDDLGSRALREPTVDRLVLRLPDRGRLRQELELDVRFLGPGLHRGLVLLGRARASLAPEPLLIELLKDPTQHEFMPSRFFEVLGFLDVVANCICEILRLPVELDGFDLKTVRKLRSNENFSEREKSWQSQDSNPGQRGEKLKRYLCAMPPPWWWVHPLP